MVSKHAFQSGFLDGVSKHGGFKSWPTAVVAGVDFRKTGKHGSLISCVGQLKPSPVRCLRVGGGEDNAALVRAIRHDGDGESGRRPTLQAGVQEKPQRPQSRAAFLPSSKEHVPHRLHCQLHGRGVPLQVPQHARQLHGVVVDRRLGEFLQKTKKLPNNIGKVSWVAWRSVARAVFGHACFKMRFNGSFGMRPPQKC